MVNGIQAAQFIINLPGTKKPGVTAPGFLIFTILFRILT